KQEWPPQHAEPGEHRENGNRKVPFGHQRQRVERARHRLVQPLERRRAPPAVIDPPSPEIKSAREPAAVDSTRPCQLPCNAVLLRPLLLEQRLGLPIPPLLLPIRAHRVAPMVPDHGGWVEPESPATLSQPPAHVHVVAGHPE